MGKRSVVIGLGGGGTATGLMVSDMDLPNVKCASLDLNSPVFGGFFSGYQRDVVPHVQHWVRTSPSPRKVSAWFDVNGRFSPLTDLPDIFARSTTRSMMRASLVMHRPAVEAWARDVVDRANTVILTTQSHGATGSAWIHEILSIVNEHSPEANVRLVLVHTRESPLGRASRPQASVNQYWTLRETSSDKELRSRTYLAGSQESASTTISALLTSNSMDTSAGELLDLDRELLDLGLDLSHHLQSSMHLSELFTKARCVPISSVLAEIDKQMIAGLLLARAESRITTSLMSENMSQLTFKARKDGAEHSINLWPARDNFRALALSHRGLGSPGHATAFDLLASEGLGMLSGQFSPLDEGVQQRLKTFELSFDKTIADAESAEHVGGDVEEVLDVYPVVLEILRRMIRA